MPVEVKMPQLGESVTEGTIGKWLKQVGEPVKKYEPLLEVITDKVDSEIPSPVEGTVIEIRVPEGEKVPVGTVLAVIEVGAVVTPAPTAPLREVAMPVAAPQVLTAVGRLSPVVAKMIADHGIDVSQIRGTGSGGRVTKKDVEMYLEARKGAPASTPTPSVAPGALEEIIPLTPMRRAIAEHMVKSKTVAPHVTSVYEVDLSRVVAYREAHKEALQQREGIDLTYTAFFVQAAVAALKAYPIVNASYSDQGIILKKRINIGVAVALPDGLIVPVIKDADNKNLAGLAKAVNDLARRAREKRLTPDDVQGGTFTITNPGIFGGLFGTPIIHQPQAAILGVGAIVKRPVVISDARGDSLAIRPMVYLGLSIDHRLLDGAIADQFMSKVKEFLENY